MIVFYLFSICDIFVLYSGLHKNIELEILFPRQALPRRVLLRCPEGLAPARGAEGSPGAGKRIPRHPPKILQRIPPVGRAKLKRLG